MEPTGRNQWQPLASARGPENGSDKPKPGPLSGPFAVELAGLEPATSWVRFMREARHRSRLCAICLTMSVLSVALSPPFAARRRGYLTKT
jgi:hypothetical protein